MPEDQWMEDAEARVAKALAYLGENSDAVQIFVCRHDDAEGTACYQKGTGNWYARMELVRGWLRAEDHADVQERTEEA